MKKLLPFLIAIGLAVIPLEAKVQFAISDGISDAGLTRRIESSMSTLLTAINEACATNSDINFSSINISEDARYALCMTWNVVHFSTEDDDIVEQIAKIAGSKGTAKGYQIRNIGVDMHPIDDTYDGDMRQELCIDFDPAGKITDINFAMPNSQYLSVMRDGARLGDTERRLQIVSWCEKLRNAYNQQDINFMDAIFSEDALIITGRVIKERKVSDVKLINLQKVEYVKQTKQQYLAKLKKIFDIQKQTKGYINVQFDDYNVVRHPSKTNYYGVTLNQKWHTRGYSDEGTLFLIWDFSNPDEPKIHVRTWQPTIDKTFTLSDFKIPDSGSFQLDR